MGLMDNHWPYKAGSQLVAKSIDWQECDREAIVTGQRAQWLAVDPKSLYDFRNKYAYLYQSVTEETRELIDARIEGRDVKLVKTKKDDTKSSILDEIEAVQQLATNDNDLTAVLKSLEMKSKIHALLNAKPEQDDRVVNIFVTTGVPRD